MRTRITNALKPITSYFDLTILEPIKEYREVNKEKVKLDSKNPEKYSFKKIVQKQKHMTSPEIKAYAYKDASSLREAYLDTLVQRPKSLH